MRRTFRRSSAVCISGGVSGPGSPRSSVPSSRGSASGPKKVSAPEYSQAIREGQSSASEFDVACPNHATARTSEQNSTQNRARSGEVNDKSGHVDERGDERGGRARGVEPQRSEEEWEQ